MLKVIKESAAWYEQGLRFECTGCGRCCTGAPGYTWVDEEEIQQIADFLNLSLDDFSRRYLRRVKGRLSLIELPKSYDCIFLKDKKCMIYPVRPIQCRTYPWWTQNLKSEKDWEEAGKFCEGICSNAPLVSLETIQEQKTIYEQRVYHTKNEG